MRRTSHEVYTCSLWIFSRVNLFFYLTDSGSNEGRTPEEQVPMESRIFILCVITNRHGVVDIQTRCTVWGSKSDGDVVFLTYPDRPRLPPIIFYSEYRLPFLGIKRPGRGVGHPPILVPKLSRG
jgi:hypothetical protein